MLSDAESENMQRSPVHAINCQDWEDSMAIYMNGASSENDVITSSLTSPESSSEATDVYLRAQVLLELRNTANTWLEADKRGFVHRCRELEMQIYKLLQNLNRHEIQHLRLAPE
jgi:hypothetical protein